MKRDMALNVFGSFLLTAAIQLVCYPFLALYYDADYYGTILLLIGVLNMVSGLLSSSLNNSRLVLQKHYEESNLGNESYASGDFNIILLGFELIAGATGLFLAFALGETILNAFFCFVVAFLIVVNGYHAVSFRLVIDYKKILLMNVVKALGYLLGLFVFRVTNVWLMPFFIGEGAGAAYCAFQAFTFREPRRITSRFSVTLKEVTMLVGGYAASSLTQYADRLFLYPVLGSSSVSCFTVASYLGKTAGVVAGPISGVLLSYYSKDKNEISLRTLFSRSVAMCIGLLVCLVLVIIVSEPVLGFFYPGLVASALEYVPLASAAAISAVFCGLIQPMLLSYAKPICQSIVQGSFLVLYVALGYLAVCFGFGIAGFCVAVLAANIMRAAMMIVFTARGILTSSSVA